MEEEDSEMTFDGGDIDLEELLAADDGDDIEYQVGPSAEEEQRKLQEMIELVENVEEDDLHVNGDQEMARSEEIKKRSIIDEKEIEASFQAAEKWKKTQEEYKNKKIKMLAPGLNIFAEKDFLNGFTAEDLNLEEDFGYTKREKLQKLGFPKKDLDEIFSDPKVFLMYLSPEANSAIISDEDDFARICDYLFFFCSATQDQLLFAECKKALFDLLRNYSYKWRLTLRHVYACLQNLGCNVNVIRQEKFMKTILESRLKVLKKSKDFHLPECHEIYQRKKSARALSENKNDSENTTRISSIKNVIIFICELVIAHPKSSDFKTTSDNWIPQLILIYLLCVVCSDKHCINDSYIFKAINLFLHFQFNHFKSSQWSGAKTSPKKNEVFLGDVAAREMPSINNDSQNALCDISEVIAQVACHESIDGIRTWTSDCLPRIDNFDKIDHHQNMVRRIQWLPLSYRGNQIKKNVAFVNMQHILNLEDMEIESFADITDVECFLRLNIAKLNVLSEESYTLFNILQLIDATVGNEPSDFTQSKIQAIKQVTSMLNTFSRDKLKNDSIMPDKARVKELIEMVTNKWQVLQSSIEEERGNEEMHLKEEKKKKKNKKEKSKRRRDEDED